MNFCNSPVIVPRYPKPPRSVLMTCTCSVMLRIARRLLLAAALVGVGAHGVSRAAAAEAQQEHVPKRHVGGPHRRTLRQPEISCSCGVPAPRRRATPTHERSPFFRRANTPSNFLVSLLGQKRFAQSYLSGVDWGQLPRTEVGLHGQCDRRRRNHLVVDRCGVSGRTAQRAGPNHSGDPIFPVRTSGRLLKRFGAGMLSILTADDRRAFLWMADNGAPSAQTGPDGKGSRDARKRRRGLWGGQFDAPTEVASPETASSWATDIQVGISRPATPRW
jgi:hypothetical protein